MNSHSYLSPMAETQSTKTLIRKEALRLFAKQGYSAVSMRELAEAVGMRQGGIYNHFKGKQALLVDLMATHMTSVLEAMDQALAGQDSPADQLTAFARNHVTFHLSSPHDVFLAYMEMRSLEPTNRATIIALRDRYEGTLKAILETGMAEGTFQINDAAVHARMLLAMMTGATVWYQEGGRLSRQDVVDCYLQGVLQSVGLRGVTT